MLLIDAFINSIVIIFFSAEASGSVHIFIKCLCWMLQKLCSVQFRMVWLPASTVGHYSFTGSSLLVAQLQDTWNDDDIEQWLYWMLQTLNQKRQCYLQSELIINVCPLVLFCVYIILHLWRFCKRRPVGCSYCKFQVQHV